MGYDRIRIKTSARQILRETSPRPWAVTLLLWFLLADLLALCLLPLMATGLFSAPAGERPPLLPILLGVVLGVGLLLLSLILHAGYAAYTLQLWRQEGPAGFADLLVGFFSASQILDLWVRLLVYTLLWAAPGTGLLLWLDHLAAVPDPVPLLVWVLSALKLLYPLYLLERVSRYAMALFALMDKPEAGAQQAIDRSKRLMAGRKVDLLVFLLSVLGWWLVIVLVAGIFFLVGGALLALVAGEAAQPDLTQAAGLLLPFLLLGLAAVIPLLLWLTAYIGTALAGFYATAAAPPFPGLQPPEFRRRDQL